MRALITAWDHHDAADFELYQLKSLVGLLDIVGDNKGSHDREQMSEALGALARVMGERLERIGDHMGVVIRAYRGGRDLDAPIAASEPEGGAR